MGYISTKLFFYFFLNKDQSYNQLQMFSEAPQDLLTMSQITAVIPSCLQSWWIWMVWFAKEKVARGLWNFGNPIPPVSS